MESAVTNGPFVDSADEQQYQFHVEATEPQVCTFCARGLEPFHLQSGTGNWWHRNEAGQLFKCTREPKRAG
jgi:hypothetical protein